jgi:hypothetical protein
MNEWQQRFAQKVDTVRRTSRERFESFADETITPVFEELREFTTQQGLDAAVPMTKPGIRILKFAVSENAYALITVRLGGLEYCEVQGEFCIPGQEKLPPADQRIELVDADADWARRVFETILDQFMDAFVASLAGRGGVCPDLVSA